MINNNKLSLFTSRAADSIGLTDMPLAKTTMGTLTAEKIITLREEQEHDTPQMAPVWSPLDGETGEGFEN